MFKVNKTNSYSIYALLAIAIYLVVSTITVEGWKEKNIMSADRANYYVYLPATFIYSDLHFEYADSLNSALGSRKVTYFLNKAGARCQKMPAGIAIMELPFFLMAHGLALSNDDYEANGYSSTYYLFIVLSALFYTLLSLIFLRKILLRFSSDRTVAIVLVLIFGGTNVLYYATYTGGMAHIPSLFLISCFIWNVLNWVDTKSTKAFSYAMLCIGLATIARPTNILFGLFLLAYIKESKWTYKLLLNHVKEHLAAYFLAVLLFLLPIIVQMALWKYMSGDWIQYSYGDEGFFFSNPKILDGFFGGRNSLFLYSPILVLSIVGVLLPRKKDFPKYSMLFVLVTFYYVIYSWWCWWYGGSLGSRAAIESYVFLALFMALSIDFLAAKLNRIIFLSMMVIFTAFSLYFAQLKAAQYKSTVLHFDSMTYQSYWDIFWSSSIPDNYNDHLLNPDYKNAKKIGLEYPDFKMMTPSQPNSEALVIAINSTEKIMQDSLYVEYSIWGKNKFKKQSLIGLTIEISDAAYLKTYSLKLPILKKVWKTGSIPIYVPSEMQKKEIKIYYTYSGDARCYYKTPILK